ncbi:14461_t:CDS:2, partial [Cetraspora pellucida]
KLEDLPNQPNIEKLSDTDDSSSVSEDENISSAGLLDSVRAAIYLLLDEL